MKLLKGIQPVKLTPARIVVLGFASLIFLGAVLLWMPVSSRDKETLRFLDALFTATSAVCVTGLVVVDTGTWFSPFGQGVVISLIQIGGVGFMVMPILLSMGLRKKIGLKERLLIQESYNQLSLAGLVRLIRNVVIVTLSFEAFGGLLLTLRFARDFPLGQAVVYGLFHAVSAFCNAGFDLFGHVFGPFSSLTAYASDWVVNGVVMGLIVAGGLGFPVLAELLRYRRMRKLSLHTKLVIFLTVTLIGIGMLLIMAMEFRNSETVGDLSPGGKMLGALFQSVTARTAGFNSLDIGAMRDGTWILLSILMFIGGSPTSTAGGIKTTTFGAVIGTVWMTIRGKADVEMFERRLPRDLLYRALTIMTLAAGWVYGITLIMALVEPFDFIRLLFETVSAFSTTGLSTGITASLTDLSKGLMIVSMFIGRVGVMTVAIALAQFNQNGTAKYIEERVIIG